MTQSAGKPLRVLLLEDSETDAILLLRGLMKGGYEVTHERTDTAKGMREALARDDWDIILSDHNMKGFDSLTALQILKETGKDLPFIIISGAIGEEVAVEAMRAGASDYLMKDRLTRLVPAIERELKEAQGRATKRQAQEDLAKAKAELEMNNQLLQAYTRKLEQSNKELAQFATVVSHDLQAPLRKVSMFTDYLMEVDQNGLSEEQVDYLNRIQKAVSRMQSLVADLLALSRINRSEDAFQHVDLQKILMSVTDDLQVQIETSGGRIEIGNTMCFDAVPTQIQQLLQNLIENAIKFHRPDVPPVVKVDCQPVGADFCQITVEDNGIGFKSEHAEVIFDVFQRLHGVDTYEGTGIGLAIVKKIVERHNGSVVAKGKPGEGSAFIITLPVKHSEADKTCQPPMAI